MSATTRPAPKSYAFAAGGKLRPFLATFGLAPQGVPLPALSQWRGAAGRSRPAAR